MGFWDAFNNMMQGKPVFHDPASPAVPNQPITVNPADTTATPLTSSGQKIRPTVAFRQTKSYANGSRLQTTAWLTNTSPVELELARLEVAGYVTDANLRLRPGEGREVRIYEGPVFQNDRNHRARLRYKIAENGDYFEAQYTVEYYRESDGMYRIEDLHPDQIPRDI